MKKILMIMLVTLGMTFISCSNNQEDINYDKQ